MKSASGKRPPDEAHGPGIAPNLKVSRKEDIRRQYVRYNTDYYLPHLMRCCQVLLNSGQILALLTGSKFDKYDETLHLFSIYQLQTISQMFRLRELSDRNLPGPGAHLHDEEEDEAEDDEEHAGEESAIRNLNRGSSTSWCELRSVNLTLYLKFSSDSASVICPFTRTSLFLKPMLKGILGK